MMDPASQHMLVTRTGHRNAKVNRIRTQTNALLLNSVACLCLMPTRYLQLSLGPHSLAAGDNSLHCPSLSPFPSLPAPHPMVFPTLLNKPLVLDMIVHVLAENPPLFTSLGLHPLPAGDTLPHCPSLPPFPNPAHGLPVLHPTQPTILRTSSAPLSMVPNLISHAPVIMVSPTLLNKPLVLDMIVHVFAQNPPFSTILGRESVPCIHTSWC